MEVENKIRRDLRSVNMTQKFKNKLIHLAVENNDFFIQKIQERIPSEEGFAIAISLQRFILTMPDLIIQIRRWMKEPTCPSQIKRFITDHGVVVRVGDHCSQSAFGETKTGMPIPSYIH